VPGKFHAHGALLPVQNSREWKIKKNPTWNLPRTKLVTTNLKSASIRTHISILAGDYRSSNDHHLFRAFRPRSKARSLLV